MCCVLCVLISINPYNPFLPLFFRCVTSYNPLFVSVIDLTIVCTSCIWYKTKGWEKLGLYNCTGFEVLYYAQNTLVSRSITILSVSKLDISIVFCMICKWCKICAGRGVRKVVALYRSFDFIICINTYRHGLKWVRYKL